MELTRCTRCFLQALVFILLVEIVPTTEGAEQNCPVQIDPPDGVADAFPISLGDVAICSTPHDCEAGNCQTCRPLNTTLLCWCDDGCELYDDCCYNTTGQSCYKSTDPKGTVAGGDVAAAQREKEQCVRTSNNAVKSGKPLPKPDYRGHWLVAGCPAGYPHADIVDGCQAQSPSFEGLGPDVENDTAELVHSVPVTSLTTGTHYKNMYCAFCRGVAPEDMTAWNITKFTCVQSKYVPSLGGLVNVECAEVAYEFYPLVAVGVDGYRLPRSCFPDLITGCSEEPAGSWAAELCGSYQAVIALETADWYRNPHCVVCNGLEEELLYPFCHNTNAAVGDNKGAPITIPFDFPSLADPAFDSVPLILECPAGFNYSLETEQCIPIADDGVTETVSCDQAIPVVNTMVAIGSNATGNSTWMESLVALLVEMLTPHKDLRTYSNLLITMSNQTVISFDLNNVSTQWVHCSDITDELSAIDAALSAMLPPATLLRVELTELCRGILNISDPLADCGTEAQVFDATNVLFYTFQNITYIYENGSKLMYETDEILLRVVYILHGDSHAVEGVSKQVVACSAAAELRCNRLVLPDESTYVIQDGVLKFNADGRDYESSDFLVLPDGSVQVCEDDFEDPWLQFTRAQTILNYVGTSLSSVALVATFVTYCTFPSLRTVPGRATMHFVVALFVAELLLLAGAGISPELEGFCTFMAIVSHYIWLATFFWMTALGFDVSRTFSMRTGPRLVDSDSHSLLLMCAFSWGAPALIVAICVVLHFVSDGGTAGFTFHYGYGGVCWIRPDVANVLAFGTPWMACLLANTVLFVRTVVGLRASKKITSFIERDKTAMQRATDEFFIYLKVSVLMGLTWIWFFIAAFTGLISLNFIAIIFNSLHGVFVFFAFVCNRRVWSMWRRKLSRSGGSGGTSSGVSSRSTLSGKMSGAHTGLTKTSLVTAGSSVQDGDTATNNPSMQHVGLNGTRL